RDRVVPTRASDRRQGGEAPGLTHPPRADRRSASPYGLGSTTTGAPNQTGRNDGHQRGENMAASGDTRWPSAGRNRWPLTAGVPKASGKAEIGTPVTMEEVADRLTSALLKVVSN